MKDIKKRNQQYKNVFGSGEGKFVLKDLLKFCHHNSPTYVLGDPYQTAYNEGMRRVALRIISIIGMSDEIIKQLSEGTYSND